jgi:hypothetical protein
MQFEKANRLNKEKDEALCKHEKIEKEYYLGTQTGDYVCSSCGKIFTIKEYEDFIKRKSI